MNITSDGNTWKLKHCENCLSQESTGVILKWIKTNTGQCKLLCTTCNCNETKEIKELFNKLTGRTE